METTPQWYYEPIRTGDDWHNGFGKAVPDSVIGHCDPETTA
jgi:hypothetical protein